MGLRISAAIALASCFALCSCATAGFRRGKVDVHGMVYDFENRPVGGYTVSLDGRRSAVSDVTGRYEFPAVPSGEYRLTGTREGYERYEHTVSVDSRTDIQYLRVASAEELLNLADAAIGEGDLESAAAYAARAEKTGSPSFLVPYYAAVIAFRSGRPGEALSLLSALESGGVRDSAVSRMKRDMLRLTGGVADEPR